MEQNGFHVDVIKTDVVEVSDSVHALPPYIAKYSEFKVADYFCPDEWSKDGVFIPVKEGDALWFDFRHNKYNECAVLCSVQKINPVTGEAANLEGGLSKEPIQNYMVLPKQKWIDGYAKDGKVYQFRITKAGEGLAVNEFVLPKHMQYSHAVGFAFYGLKNPKPKQIINYNELINYGLDNIQIKQSTKRYDLLYRKDQQFSHVLRSNTSTSGHFSGQFQSDSKITTAGLTSPAPVAGQAFSCETQDTAMNCFCDAITADISDVETEDRLQKNTVFDKASMGAGGRIEQTIHTDSNSIDYYVEKPSAVLVIYFCLPEQLASILAKGKRQDVSKKDKFVFSGEIGNVQVPLIK